MNHIQIIGLHTIVYATCRYPTYRLDSPEGVEEIAVFQSGIHHGAITHLFLFASFKSGNQRERNGLCTIFDGLYDIVHLHFRTMETVLTKDLIGDEISEIGRNGTYTSSNVCIC